MFVGSRNDASLDAINTLTKPNQIIKPIIEIKELKVELKADLVNRQTFENDYIEGNF